MVFNKFSERGLSARYQIDEIGYLESDIVV